MTKDVEHSLKFLLAIYDSAVENSLFSSVHHFKLIIWNFDVYFLEFFIYFGDQSSV